MSEMTCADLTETLRSQESDRLEAARRHAASCPACREQLRQWEEISAAAPSLHKDWETPELWARIRESLRTEGSRHAASRARGGLFGVRRWLPIAAGIGLFLIAAAGLLVFKPSSGGREPLVSGPWRYQDPLMTEQALDDVEGRERAYLEAIERLSKLVASRLEQPGTPLLSAYREKLLLLDAGIAEIRGEIERNRYNTHLRRELLARYAEKQRTLQDLMKEAQS